MTTACAWCGKILKITTDHPDLISHGICPACAEKVEREHKAARRG